MSVDIERFFQDPDSAKEHLEYLQEKHDEIESKFATDTGVNPQCEYCATVFTESEGMLLNNPEDYDEIGLDGIRRKGTRGTVSRTRVQCPKCKAIMKKTTAYLIANMTVEDYGARVYWLKKYDVDHKVKFQAILDYIRANRVNSQFWNGYHAERDKDPTAKTYRKPESSNTS
jgi:hypothetical protein